MAPQIIYLFLFFINLLVTAHMHGKPKGEFNFWITFFGSSIGILLLFWGGFFEGFFK